MGIRTRLAVAIAVAIAASTMVVNAPVNAAINIPVIFHASIGFCFFGEGPPDTDIRITWRDVDGTRKAKFTVHTSDTPGGFWNPPDQVCESLRVEPRDTIRSSVVPYPDVRTFTVDRLTVAFDRQTDVVSGRASASGSLEVGVIRCGLFFCFLFPTQLCPVVPVPIDIDGRYSRDESDCDDGGYDAIGGDIATVTWTGPSSDTIDRQGSAPFVRVAVGGHLATGATTGGRSVDILIRRPNGTIRGSGHAVADVTGQYKATLRNGSGQNITVHAGDHVSGDWAGGTTFILPEIVLDVSDQPGIDDDQISGHCMPTVVYQVLHVRSNGFGLSGGTTDAGGGTGVIDVPAGFHSNDLVRLGCQRPNGDQVEARARIP